MFWEICENKMDHKLYIAYGRTSASNGSVTHGILELNQRCSTCESHDAYLVNGRVLGLCVLSMNKGALLICADGVAENGELGLAILLDCNNGWRRKKGCRRFEALSSLHMMEVSPGLVVCGELLNAPSRALNIVRISQNLQIKSISKVSVPNGLITFDARFIKGEILLALVFGNGKNSYVQLNRLNETNSLQVLSLLKFENIDKVLWCGDRLVAGQWNSKTKTHSVFEIKLEDFIITKGSLLLNDRNIFRWCSNSNKYIIIADDNTKDIHICNL